MSSLPSTAAETGNSKIRFEDFDYDLPPELIAQHPAADRAASRMLALDRASGNCEDSHFRHLAERLQPGDVLVVNNSRVLPARLLGRRAGVRSMPIGKKNPARGEFLKSEIETLLVRQIGRAHV